MVCTYSIYRWKWNGHSPNACLSFTEITIVVPTIGYLRLCSIQARFSYCYFFRFRVKLIYWDKVSEAIHRAINAFQRDQILGVVVVVQILNAKLSYNSCHSFGQRLPVPVLPLHQILVQFKWILFLFYEVFRMWTRGRFVSYVIRLWL